MYFSVEDIDDLIITQERDNYFLRCLAYRHFQRKLKWKKQVDIKWLMQKFSHEMGVTLDSVKNSPYISDGMIRHYSRCYAKLYEHTKAMPLEPTPPRPEVWIPLTLTNAVTSTTMKNDLLEAVLQNTAEHLAQTVAVEVVEAETKAPYDLPDLELKCVEPPFQPVEPRMYFEDGRSDVFNPDRLLEINRRLRLRVQDPDEVFTRSPSKADTTKGDYKSKEPLSKVDARSKRVLDAKWDLKRDEKLYGNGKGQCNGNKRLFQQKEANIKENERKIYVNRGRIQTPLKPADIRAVDVPAGERKLRQMTLKEKALLDLCGKMKVFCEKLAGRHHDGNDYDDCDPNTPTSFMAVDFQERFGLNLKLQRHEWTRFCQTNFHACAYALMSAATKDWSLFRCMDLLRAFGVLNVHWLTTAGTYEERIAWLKRIMLYAGYNFHDRAAKLVGLAHFIKDKGGIPKAPVTLLEVNGMGPKVTPLFYQEMEMNIAPVVDRHVAAACKALGLVPSNSSEARIVLLLKEWLPQDYYKLFNEAICGIRMAYQDTQQKDQFWNAVRCCFPSTSDDENDCDEFQLVSAILRDADRGSRNPGVNPGVSGPGKRRRTTRSRKK